LKNTMYITFISVLALISGLNTANFTSKTPVSPVIAVNDPAVSYILTEDDNTAKTYDVWVTAYSSTPDQTDSTPFITASGIRVKDGIIAVNFLPFGTKVLIPELFGDKVFTVEDRMHRRKTNNVDIWMSSRSKALKFGIARAKIVILEEAPKLFAQD